MEILLTKGPGGALIPLDDDEAAKLGRIKTGGVVRADVSQMRNGAFFRKWWVLAKYAFDLWSETVEPIEYKGQPVLPEFQRFRKDLTILAGHYTPVFNARGELRLEAKSIAWANMAEDEFERLYSATIDVILRKILSGTSMTEAQLRAHVDNVLRFS
jgi:hypothetical protein